MKNQPFLSRLRFALTGIRMAHQAESSFRIQVLFAIGSVILLLALRPKPIWWAAVALTSGSVLAAELMNSAFELVVDRLHPEEHPTIGRAKDCAAGAVLILSLASLVVAGAMVLDL
jgi:diacylglycerol kinase (ATP)